MNTREKIDRAANTTLLCLHKEGIFYKLYNQQAMLFTQNIKPLKINVEFVKVVDQQVYSCGFPATIIEDVKNRLASPAEKDGGIALTNIEKQIVAFQVMRKTPMEAMNFIVELQRQLNGKQEC